MKQFYVAFLCLIFPTLIGCSGSDTYRGDWNAMTLSGEKSKITFEPKKMIVTDSAGKSVTIDYTQNSVNVEGSVETYGIKLEDGRGYKINFPIGNNESIGVIKDENENVLYSISRKGYVKYDDIYKLN